MLAGVSIFSAADGEGDGVALLEDFFLAEVEVDEVEALLSVEVFFLVVADVVDALVVPAFLVVVDVVGFLPVVAVPWLEEAVSFLWAHETTKAAPTSRTVRVKAVFFIELCKGLQPVQTGSKSQA